MRYIWGGDDGSDAKGSGGCRVDGMAGDVMTPEEGTIGRTLSGAGAPLTIWSSLASAIAFRGRRGRQLVTAMQCSGGGVGVVVHGRRGCKATPGTAQLLCGGRASRRLAPGTRHRRTYCISY